MGSGERGEGDEGAELFWRKVYNQSMCDFNVFLLWISHSTLRSMPINPLTH